MKKTLIILSAFFLVLNSFGQIEKELDSVLATKDFLKFKEYTSKLPKSETGESTGGNWTYLREVTKGFQEGIFVLHKVVPNIDTVNIYRVTLITTDKQLIFYELSEMRNHVEPLDKYKNDSVFKIMCASFKETYNAPLIEQELFIDSIYYGRSCDRREMLIDKYVKDKDTSTLLKWLQSTNTERQIYAVNGFLQLKKKFRISPTNDEKNMIVSVLNKKGTMLTCEFDYDLGSENIYDVAGRLKQ